jgi:hypothetical protein
MTESLFSYMHTLISKLLLDHMGTFIDMGRGLYLSFATLILCWHGIKVAMGQKGFDFGHFARLILILAGGFGMTYSYRIFAHLIIDQFAVMTDKIGGTAISDLSDKVTIMVSSVAVIPSVGDIWTAIVLFIFHTSMAFVIAAAYAVSVWGMVAQAVVVILGPMFVPFAIIPKLDFLFWSWLKSLMIYSSYQLIAAGVLYVFSKLFVLLVNFDANHSLGSDEFASIWMFAVIACLVTIFGILSIPQLAMHIFSGMGGSNPGRDMISSTVGFAGGQLSQVQVS